MGNENSDLRDLPHIDPKGLEPYLGKDIFARELGMWESCSKGLEEEERRRGIKGRLGYSTGFGLFMVDMGEFGEYAMVPSKGNWILGLPDGRGNFEEHLYVERKP